MTDLDGVPTWKGKQSLAARIAEALRAQFADGFQLKKPDAQKLASLQRVANFDKKITEEEIRVRLRAGEW